MDREAKFGLHVNFWEISEAGNKQQNDILLLSNESLYFLIPRKDKDPILGV